MPVKGVLEWLDIGGAQAHEWAMADDVEHVCFSQLAV
jgi:hypothetical protein